MTKDLGLFAVKVGKAYFDAREYELAKEFYNVAQKV
jgi:hypothetical protein